MTHTTDSSPRIDLIRARRKLAKWAKLAQRHTDLPENADERHERETLAWLRAQQL